ncbi:helix-turn-helix domain-containing protein [Agrobacterium sp. SORGH_AS 787]|uniref:helix-turn-helix domain-containing protein n=1 Tax=Agrobacterium sp. SORGH_AS 787 TaxID=3041775 RepID=UPI00277ED579|nr:AraC-like DNA-binding protein [Rhizobium sp. SORGH_AS_0787]
MLEIVSPTDSLKSVVHSYWFIEDLTGRYSRDLIRTSPIPLAVLSINMGRPNMLAEGGTVPDVSLLGLQTQARAWKSVPGTRFVMMMLTIKGFVRLFPNMGIGSADRLLDFSDVFGDPSARVLKSSIGEGQTSQQIASVLDGWIVQRMSKGSSSFESRQLAVAYDVIRAGGLVEAAAQHVGMGSRQLHRLFVRHIGVAPKQVADIERLHHSLSEVQRGGKSSLAGYSDQSHQIRQWRRRLNLTPGAYAETSGQQMERYFGQARNVPPLSYYL